MPTVATPWTSRVLVVLLPAFLGAAGLLTASLSGKGSALFYVATFFTAAVYVTVWLLGPVRTSSPAECGRYRGLDGPGWARGLVRGAGIGLALLAVFALGALVVRSVPVLADPVGALLDNLRQGPLALTILTTAVNGVAEELFFRDVVPHGIQASPRLVAICSVGLYAAVTVAMGVPLLVFAALVIGGATYAEARTTRRLHSPIALHLVWSLGMLVVLPPLMGA
ncbi:CPBP family glutamic-type intramembrane protease [Rothia koreensis]|uniref:CPBP family glutamic-type intramembrane protease n=1 Tax=Rothia koreensis TaxID=592378 RepID=UPI003F228DCB